METKKRLSFILYVTAIVGSLLVAFFVMRLHYLSPNYLNSDTEIIIAQSISFLMAIVGALLLYHMRENARALYAMTEISLSLLTLAYLFFYSDKIEGLLAIDVNAKSTDATITAMAGVYFMIRGLDNLGTGLREYPRLHARWERVWHWGRI